MMLLNGSKWLINCCIPNHLVSDICGDLEEEYTTLVLPKHRQSHANFWLIQQTLSICSHFILTAKNLFSVFSTLIATSLLFTMIVAIFWLSDLSDPNVLSADFWQGWQAGNTYRVFFEPVLWNSVSKAFTHPIDWSLWFYQPALIYASVSLYLLHKIQAITKHAPKKALLAALVIIFIPHLGGWGLLFFVDIPMNQSGPIAAFTWLSTLYLLLPINYQVINTLKTHEGYAS
jgi:hypothetical protein